MMIKYTIPTSSGRHSPQGGLVTKLDDNDDHENEDDDCCGHQVL